ncbi:MAG: WXG100 family type VII secretion target [Rhodococcus sp. (in: high G+C Gram-positive bacteria)]
MSSAFAWSDGGATDASARVDAAMTAIQSDIADLDALVRGLTEWVGNERENYDAVFEHWSSATANVSNVLAGVSGLIDGINQGVNDFKASIMTSLG